MAISLKPDHLKRYKDIAGLFIKYGRSDMVPAGGNGLDGDTLIAQEPVVSPEADEKASQFADDLEKMGPIYVKLGQVLSSRPDILPYPYIKALSRLQDKVEPFPYEEVERVIAEELGVRISKAFSEFDREPIATASLGQVHRAALRDGRQVAVKVQRPNIRESIASDMEALAEIAEFIDKHTEIGRRYQFLLMLDEFRKNLVRELDYQQEMRNLIQFGKNLRSFQRIVVPQPVEDYCSPHVLTMDYVHGRKITSMGPLAPMHFDTEALAEELFKAYLQQILVDGLYHADPHPGNVFVTNDGRIALIDLGMVGRVSPRMQEQLLKILLAISEGHSDQVADISMKIGDVQDEFDETTFRRGVADMVARQQGATVEEMQIGLIVLEVTRLSADNGIRTPPELTMLGKTLLNLDEVGRTLNPKFEPNNSIRRNAGEMMRQRTLKSASPGNMLSSAMETKEFIQELPGRVNRILDAVAHNNLKIKVDALDENALFASFQKIANRITVGLILAALIIGAAMLMRVETSFRIFGYPGLAMLFFLGAAGGGVGLVLNILASDRKDRNLRGQ